MGFAKTVGNYQLGRTIGEGTFAKVKLAMNTRTHQSVAIKVIDKLAYTKRLGEEEARKYFQQMIDAIDYCHGKGIYHRDLKPENLLLDGKGNFKVSDFGLSAIGKPNDLLSTACGSPSYVAPEVISNRGYDGAAADIWSCGVILFELLAGYLPFEDRNLVNLYRKISRAEYTCPEWFTASQRKLLFKILDPMPTRRMTVAEILEDKWFQTNYKACTEIEHDKNINMDDIHTAFDTTMENATEIKKTQSTSFINAFQLIAMSNDLDLSGLFEEQDEDRHKIKLGSKHPMNETIEKIEFAAKDMSLSVERMNNSKVKLHQKNKLSRCSRSYFNLSVEVTEVTPTNCVVEISSSEGEITIYKEFCRSLSGILREKTSASKMFTPPAGSITMKDTQEEGCHEEEKGKMDSKQHGGYSSS